LVLLAGMTRPARQGFWRNAMFSAPLEAIAADVKPWLPEGFLNDQLRMILDNPRNLSDR